MLQLAMSLSLQIPAMVSSADSWSQHAEGLDKAACVLLTSVHARSR